MGDPWTIRASAAFLLSKKTWRVSLTRNASCWLFSSMFIINVNTVNNHQFTMFINVDKTSAFSLLFILSMSSLSEIVSLTVTWFQWRTSDEVISHTTLSYHQISSNIKRKIIRWIRCLTIKYHQIFKKKHQMNQMYVIIKNHHFNGKKKKKTPGPPRVPVGAPPARTSARTTRCGQWSSRPPDMANKNGAKWL